MGKSFLGHAVLCMSSKLPIYLCRRYRYIAYRQFVRWIYHRLGRDVRIPLPSCVTKRIRDAFPSATGEYAGFKYPSLDMQCRTSTPCPGGTSSGDAAQLQPSLGGHNLHRGRPLRPRVVVAYDPVASLSIVPRLLTSARQRILFTEPMSYFVYCTYTKLIGSI